MVRARGFRASGALPPHDLRPRGAGSPVVTKAIGGPAAWDLARELVLDLRPPGLLLLSRAGHNDGS
eukprot:CAMPEP_0115048054 /NCGR_PEP_ID=MMETSP0227-20121206/335_1 /TAXON_ID=89957 /ORGANISM="Polarella glacialis, Strain CCMP 1383" /LENGTH=65 /DNA_ID=CAMNT_0002431395 /DNA_START=63 /DNA_END=260 /DNA_ORIENTATION=-